MLHNANWTVDNGQFMIAPCDDISSTNCVITNTGTWWPQYWVNSYPVQDKFGQAFRIAQKLMEMKVVKIDNDVQKFVKLVNAIAENL